MTMWSCFQMSGSSGKDKGRACALRETRSISGHLFHSHLLLRPSGWLTPVLTWIWNLFWSFLFHLLMLVSENNQAFFFLFLLGLEINLFWYTSSPRHHLQFLCLIILYGACLLADLLTTRTSGIIINPLVSSFGAVVYAVVYDTYDKLSQPHSLLVPLIGIAMNH